MKHPRQHVLLAYMDGETDIADTAAVARHMEECERCAAVVTRQRHTTRASTAAISGFDALEPAEWGRSDALSDAAPVPPAQAAHPWARGAARRPHRFTGGWGWAAAVLLTTGAAAAAVLVALPEFGPGLGQRPGERGGEAATASPMASSVRVQPREGAAEIVLSEPGAGSRLIVERSSAADVVVSVTGLAAPRFRAADGRVEALLAGATAMVRVTVPLGPGSVVIIADGSPIATVRNGVAVPAQVLGTGISLKPREEQRE